MACGAAMVLVLTGCLEINHHVTMTDSRTVGTFVKVGISRQMMEMAQAFAEHEMATSDSCNTIIGSGEHLADRFTDDVVPGARVVQLEMIDTDMECGILFHFELDTLLLRWLDDEVIPFLVSVTEDRVDIFLPGVGDGDRPDDLTLAFLAPLKYRITISKTLMEYISSAYLSYAHSEYSEAHGGIELDVIDMIDQHLIEISLALLFVEDRTATVTLFRE